MPTDVNRLLAWFIGHKVAANLLMLAIMVLGLVAMQRLQTEVIPTITMDWLDVELSVPGLTAAEMEQAWLPELEQHIKQLKHVDSVHSELSPGQARLQVNLQPGRAKAQLQVQTDIQSFVDRLALPPNAEPVQIRQVRFRPAVAMLAIQGESYRDLLVLAQTHQENIRHLAGVGQVILHKQAQQVVKVLLEPNAMLRYQVGLAEVATALTNSQRQFSSGQFDREGRATQLLTEQGASSSGLNGLRNLVVRIFPDGSQLRLSDIASLELPDFTQGHRLNNRPAVLLAIHAEEGAGLVEVARKLRKYTAQAQSQSASSVELALWQDTSKYFRARADLLLQNGLFGLGLLFVLLTIALNRRLGLWISAGILVAFLGGFIALWVFGFTLNMVSLFAFVLVLGVLVDDAIIVGESIDQAASSGLSLSQSAVVGASRVAKPVIVAAMTTMLMFVPVLFLPGDEGRMLRAIPIVVIAALFFSLVESLLILPAHLSAASKQQDWRWTQRLRIWLIAHTKWLWRAGQRLVYASFQRPWVVQAVFGLGLVIVVLGFGMGLVRYGFFAKIEGDLAYAKISMIEGAHQHELDQVLDEFEAAALELQRRHAEDAKLPNIKNVLRYASDGQTQATENEQLTGLIALEMSTDANREVAAATVAERWRNMVTSSPLVQAVDVQSTLNPERHETSVFLESDSRPVLMAAASQIAQWLSQQSGVALVRSIGNSPTAQLVVSPNAYASSQGLNSQSLSGQVNLVQTEKELLSLPLPTGLTPVTLNLADAGEQSKASLGRLPILVGQSQVMPLEQVSGLQTEQQVQQLSRINGRPSVELRLSLSDTAPVWLRGNQWIKNIEQVLARDFPQVQANRNVYQAEQQEIERYLLVSLGLAILGMYAVLAIILRSYGLPLVILYAVPFGLEGAVLGHWLLSVTFTLYSLVGAFAVSGIVVNDNLVLLDRYREYVYQGLAPQIALLQAVNERTKAVLLTSVTTIIGMLPLILDTSIQAQFLMPMALAIASGLALATFVTLLLVPSCVSLSLQAQQSRGLLGLLLRAAQQRLDRFTQ